MSIHNNELVSPFDSSLLDKFTTSLPTTGIATLTPEMQEIAVYLSCQFLGYLLEQDLLLEEKPGAKPKKQNPTQQEYLHNNQEQQEHLSNNQEQNTDINSLSSLSYTLEQLQSLFQGYQDKEHKQLPWLTLTHLSSALAILSSEVAAELLTVQLYIVEGTKVSKEQKQFIAFYQERTTALTLNKNNPLINSLFIGLPKTFPYDLKVRQAVVNCMQTYSNFTNSKEGLRIMLGQEIIPFPCINLSLLAEQQSKILNHIWLTTELMVRCNSLYQHLINSKSKDNNYQIARLLKLTPESISSSQQVITVQTKETNLEEYTTTNPEHTEKTISEPNNITKEIISEPITQTVDVTSNLTEKSADTTDNLLKQSEQTANNLLNKSENSTSYQFNTTENNTSYQPKTIENNASKQSKTTEKSASCQLRETDKSTSNHTKQIAETANYYNEQIIEQFINLIAQDNPLSLLACRIPDSYLNLIEVPISPKQKQTTNNYILQLNLSNFAKEDINLKSFSSLPYFPFMVAMQLGLSQWVTYQPFKDIKAFTTGLEQGLGLAYNNVAPYLLYDKDFTAESLYSLPNDRILYLYSLASQILLEQESQEIFRNRLNNIALNNYQHPLACAIVVRIFAQGLNILTTNTRRKFLFNRLQKSLLALAAPWKYKL